MTRYPKRLFRFSALAIGYGLYRIMQFRSGIRVSYHLKVVE